METLFIHDSLVSGRPISFMHSTHFPTLTNLGQVYIQEISLPSMQLLVVKNFGEGNSLSKSTTETPTFDFI